MPTAVVRQRSIHGNNRVVFADVTLDASYATGGMTLNPRDVGLSSRFDFVQCAPSGGYVFEFDHTNNKIKVFVEEAVAAGGPLLELANASNISTVITRVRAEGV